MFLDLKNIVELNKGYNLGYVIGVVVMQIIGLLYLRDKWRESWVKEIKSILVIYLLGYFLPLGIKWQHIQ